MLLFLLGIVAGGFGNYPTDFGIVVISIGVAIMTFSTLLSEYQTLQLMAGTGTLGYGIWWMFLPNIETHYNLMTATLLICGFIVTFYSLSHPPKYKLNKLLFLLYAVTMTVIAIWAFYMWHNNPMP